MATKEKKRKSQPRPGNSGVHGAERERGTGHVEVHHDQEQEEHARKARTQEIQSVSQEGDGTQGN